jgi:uncharacterized protein YegL
MTDEATQVRRYPIYLVLDVSESMRRRPGRGRSAYSVFVPLLDKLTVQLAEAPRINVAVWMSTLAFSDGVQVLRPMTPLSPPGAPDQVSPGNETNYTAVLRFLADQYPRDALQIQEAARRARCEARVARPWIFLITDGAPFANRRDQEHVEWLTERERLVTDPIRARIAAISLRNEREATLWQLATGLETERNAFIARSDASHEQLAKSIEHAILVSITQSVRKGDSVMPTPRGMRRVRRPND